jgi:hypothetical protein
MADYSLEAVTNPLFLTDPESTTKTDVNYSALFPIFLWKRVNGIQWVREDLNDPMPATLEEAKDRQKKGTRTSNSLSAGGFVEYGMLLEPYVDPNASWFEQKSFVAYLIIDYLFGSKTLVGAGPDDGLFPGGTFVRKVVTTPDKTRLRMQVGREPPLTTANGLHRLPNPIAEVTSDLSQLHDVEASSLVSGTRHFAVTLLIGERGEWQSISEPFITKRRKVKIQFKEFEVVNDSDEDPWKDGDDAEVTFRVYKGMDQVEGGELKWGPGNINDAGAARFVKVNFPDVVVGPEDLNGIDPPVSIGVYALERDYFFWFTSTDEAEYDEEWQPGRPLHTKRLPFPTGRANENVNPPEIVSNFDIWTSPVGGDGELRIKANVRYVVTYD